MRRDRLSCRDWPVPPARPQPQGPVGAGCGLVGFARMGRGARSTVRWKHDRIRRKKARDARARVKRAEARKSED